MSPQGGRSPAQNPMITARTPAPRRCFIAALQRISGHHSAPVESYPAPNSRSSSALGRAYDVHGSQALGSIPTKSPTQFRSKPNSNYIRIQLPYRRQQQEGKKSRGWLVLLPLSRRRTRPGGIQGSTGHDEGRLTSPTVDDTSPPQTTTSRAPCRR